MLTLLAGALIAGAVAWAVVQAWSRRKPEAPALGTVSQTWLTEQRLNRPDSQR